MEKRSPMVAKLPNVKNPHGDLCHGEKFMLLPLMVTSIFQVPAAPLLIQLLAKAPEKIAEEDGPHIWLSAIHLRNSSGGSSS